VAFFVDFQELSQINVGVFLGGGQALVPQKLLDDPQIRTPAQKVRREGVAKRVRADLPTHSRDADVFIDNPLH